MFFFSGESCKDSVIPDDPYSWSIVMDNDGNVNPFLTRKHYVEDSIDDIISIFHKFGFGSVEASWADNYVFSSADVPHCSCGGIIKPDVVLYEEGLDTNVVKKAIKEISNADLLLVCGTSLNVYPAASFLNYYNGDNLVLINRDPTSWDKKANIVIHDSLGKVFSIIDEKIKEGYFSN